MEIDFISSLHKSTKRDYLARVNDKDYSIDAAAKLAKNGDIIIGMEVEKLTMEDTNILKVDGQM